MKYTRKFLGAAGVAALMGLTAGQAHAAGTASGTSVVNTATVNFSVGGVAQTVQTAANTFVVDSKIVLTNVTSNASAVSVSPGQSGAVTTFKITNSSNTTIDVGLAAVAQATGATTAHGGTSAVTASGFTYWVDTSGTGVYNASTVTQVTYLDELAPDTSKTVFVLSNIPITAANGQYAGINLTATAEQGGTANSQGTVLASSTGAWTPGTVQIVLADATGTGGDSNYDGKIAALDDYVISAPVITVTKLSTVVSDPVDGTTNPKAIPGAVIQYCIVVANATGGATATNLGVSDPLPTTVTYKAGSVVLNATVTGSGTTATCGAGTAGSDSTNYTASTTTVSGALSNLPAGSSEALVFQATIN